MTDLYERDPAQVYGNGYVRSKNYGHALVEIVIMSVVF